MPDRDKLLRGLRCLAEREEGSCDDCICKDSKNYSQCIYEIAGYALDMLEEQASHLEWLYGEGKGDTE